MQRKNYEIKLHKLFPEATPEQVDRIRTGAADLLEGADWHETVAWVREG